METTKAAKVENNQRYVWLKASDPNKSKSAFCMKTSLVNKWHLQGALTDWDHLEKKNRVHSLIHVVLRYQFITDSCFWLITAFDQLDFAYSPDRKTDPLLILHIVFFFHNYWGSPVLHYIIQSVNIQAHADPAKTKRKNWLAAEPRWGLSFRLMHATNSALTASFCAGDWWLCWWDLAWSLQVSMDTAFLCLSGSSAWKVHSELERCIKNFF